MSLSYEIWVLRYGLWLNQTWPKHLISLVLFQDNLYNKYKIYILNVGMIWVTDLFFGYKSKN